MQRLLAHRQAGEQLDLQTRSTCLHSDSKVRIIFNKRGTEDGLALQTGVEIFGASAEEIFVDRELLLLIVLPDENGNCRLT